jgi:hypothetical protein
MITLHPDTAQKTPAILKKVAEAHEGMAGVYSAVTRQKEFDEVAAELGRTLDFCKVPAREKGEVLAAFAAHKKGVTAGYMAK